MHSSKGFMARVCVLACLLRSNEMLNTQPRFIFNGTGLIDAEDLLIIQGLPDGAV